MQDIHDDANARLRREEVSGTEGHIQKVIHNFPKTSSTFIRTQLFVPAPRYTPLIPVSDAACSLPGSPTTDFAGISAIDFAGQAGVPAIDFAGDAQTPTR